MEVEDMKQNRYSTFEGSNRLDQYQLQRLAKDIMDNGTVTEVSYHAFSTNKYTDDFSIQSFKDGSRCVAVEGFGMKYYIHFKGLRVYEIIEIEEIK
jgi:hypothetical protein